MPRPLRISVELEPEQYNTLLEVKTETGATLVFQIRKAIEEYTNKLKQES